MKLLLPKIARSINSRQCMSLYLCVCGAEIVRRDHDVKRGNTRSCGCLKREATRQRVTTHGLSGTKEHIAWHKMIQRCTNHNNIRWDRYGGRGISVCPQWRHSFETFLADVGHAPSKAHSLDRIDSNGNYEPGNVRWSTDKEQANNTSSNFRLTYLGREQTLKQWAEELGLPASTISLRIRRLGWSVERALSTPLQGRRSA